MAERVKNLAQSIPGQDKYVCKVWRFYVQRCRRSTANKQTDRQTDRQTDKHNDGKPDNKGNLDLDLDRLPNGYWQLITSTNDVIHTIYVHIHNLGSFKINLLRQFS